MLHDAAIPGGEGAFGRAAARRAGRLDEGGADPAVAAPGFAGAAFARTLVLPGTEAGPTGEVLGGRKDGHVDAQLSDKHFRGPLVDAGDGVEAGEFVSARRHDDIDLAADRVDGLV